jgi:phytoene dehydrogenase-like protein
LDFPSNDVKRSGVIQIGDSLDEISKAYNECVTGKVPKRPFMTINNTSCYDPSRAPPGKHTLWNFVRAPVLLDGKMWTAEEKERFANSCTDRLSEYAPNAKQIILKEVILSPQDIESLNPNLVSGDPAGGSVSLDQSGALRPFPRWSQYKTPIKGLYMFGPTTHPGGGVTGLPGRNAALVALSGIV